MFPLPYESTLRREAERNDFDPMFAAGLIRQESTFQADVVSHANAIGLMQILPKTGRRLAKQRKVRYIKSSLFDPNINTQLGMLYIADLTRSTGAPEYAAAAYNAGEDRIAAWKAERAYDEIPELVESIPFTQTREYVQIVLRNAFMYRKSTASPQIHRLRRHPLPLTRRGRLCVGSAVRGGPLLGPPSHTTPVIPPRVPAPERSEGSASSLLVAYVLFGAAPAPRQRPSGVPRLAATFAHATSKQACHPRSRSMSPKDLNPSLDAIIRRNSVSYD